MNRPLVLCFLLLLGLAAYSSAVEIEPGVPVVTNATQTGVEFHIQAQAGTLLELDAEVLSGGSDKITLAVRNEEYEALEYLQLPNKYSSYREVVTICPEDNKPVADFFIRVSGQGMYRFMARLVNPTLGLEKPTTGKLPLGSSRFFQFRVTKDQAFKQPLELLITSNTPAQAVAILRRNSCPSIEHSFLQENISMTRFTKQVAISLSSTSVPVLQEGLWYMAVAVEGFDTKGLANTTVKDYSITLRPSLPYTEYAWPSIFPFLSLLIIGAMILYQRYELRRQGNTGGGIESWRDESRPLTGSLSLSKQPASGFLHQSTAARSHFMINVDVTSMEESEDNQYYVFAVFMAAAFFGIPSFQYVFGQFTTVHDSGGARAQCYYNTLCSRPLYFTAYNTMWSNWFYVICGIGFVWYVNAHQSLVRFTGRGVPHRYSLYQALGYAIVAEGIFSAMYHICPTRVIFQFDTSFMFIIAGITTVVIYQKRHLRKEEQLLPVKVFPWFAAIILLNYFGSVVDTTHNIMRQEWRTFLLVALLLFIAVFDLFVLFGVLMGGESWSRSFSRQVFRRVFANRNTLALFVFLNVVDIVAVVVGVTLQKDFAMLLLGIVVLNAFVFLCYYLILKMAYDPAPIPRTTWLLLVITLALWAVAFYFFEQVTTNKNVSLPDSQNLNRNCALLNFYDYHDIWHMCSAFALLSQSLFLFHLDDGLEEIPSSDLRVF